MKVAHITSVHSSNDNRIFYKECTTLQRNGFEVILIAAGARNDLINGVKIIGYKKTCGNRIKRIIKTSFIDMLNQCNIIDADIYHFHDPELIFIGLYLKIIGKKVIYDIHENNPASILSKPYIKTNILKKLISKTFNLFEQLSVNFFDAVVAARPDISKRFRHKNLITLRNFPILPVFSKLKKIEIDKVKPSFIYVGGITKIRGINELIDAFEKLDQYELWLLGPITDAKLKNRINAGCKNVKYFGIVEAFEVFSYIQKADVGLINFLPEPNHLNTLATKPFEYMACGKPMIMSNFNYWKETFKESSLYVDPNDIDKIREAIVELINDEGLIFKMSKLNKRLASDEYNWEEESKKLIQMYSIF
jgi:glycosyltransferase involved in cell wall biosynthesis